MPQFLELVIIAFLVLISVELLLIHRDLMRHQARLVSHGDEPPGQTINVNVGSPGNVAAVPVVAAQERIEERKEDKPLATMVEASEATQPKIEPVVPEPRSERPSMDTSSRSTSSGLIAKKCPKCSMENSNYRSECFNCGASL